MGFADQEEIPGDNRQKWYLTQPLSELNYIIVVKCLRRVVDRRNIIWVY